MLDFLYQSGWGAFSMTLFMFVPFIVIYLYVIFRKTFLATGPSGTDPRKISRIEVTWLAVVFVVFIGVNIASISYMPPISSAKAALSEADIMDVEVTANSWYYDISNSEIETGRPIRFSAKSTDTMHGFAIYHPNGKILFTLMLMPGLETPTSVIHTFDEPGTYTVRCLEYCGISHHEMRDELVVVSRN
jgi:cytochrome c oxidase subunit 2